MPNTDEEMMCMWPNGECKPVVVMSTHDGMADIIWNEQVDTDCAVVTGMDETVPVSWLTPFAGTNQ